MKQKQPINDINAPCGNLPPQAIEAEEAVLGALMLERDAFQQISGIVDRKSFYKEEHQKIFDVIKYLSANQKPIDLLMVTQELKSRNLLEDVGGPLLITQLTSRVASAAHIEAHCRIIAEKFYQREMIRSASEMLKLAYQDEDVELLGNEWKRYGDELENVFTIADSGTSIRDVLRDTVKEIESDCNNIKESKTPGIPTGFSSLNENTGGWRPGNMIVLAGRPGLGKTSFALYFALEAAKAGYFVNVFSLEMNKQDLARILLAAEGDIYRSNIRDGYLTQNDWQKLHNAISKLEKLPIIFRDSSGMTVSQIQSAIRKNRRNGRCHFAIVDYLQLVKASQNKTNRELEVAEISRTLKTTALTENIPIMALSQLNRAADGEAPKLSNLRESGAIEQDADLVCFLHKPDQNNSIIRFTVAKHRRGRLGEIDIHFNTEMTKFSESSFNSINESTNNPF
jgi:replicative DNA helicase